ncbi:uncharacterized protein LOC115753304 isoform X2 [Rhodamnia argentea]|uniref:Uncharacterized protein LOC115753304 isoform X2 n=1 Tax=Rhodamnia argentea TaxID=178133 RepID=A0A8B8QKZ7_9MYRT|nr:uncharacterized protein LOC115753304 isoform X2 [Rhodamnia argentea]
MGGEVVDSVVSGGSSSEGEVPLDESFASQVPTLFRDGLSRKVGSKTVKEDDVLGLGDFEGEDGVFSSALESEVNLRRRSSTHREVLGSYDDSRVHIESLGHAKSKILSYYPGAWIEEVGGTKSFDYKVPQTTSLILIGPRGSGKSSLVNRISKLLDDDKFASERAQVSYNSSAGDGTYFLQEYMIPRGSTSFCLYDTRSLSTDPSEDSKIIKRWMTKGVRHGELVIRESDDWSLRKRMRCKARWSCHPSSVIRRVNFVIFVVNSITVLTSMDNNHDGQSQYMQLIADTYNCPYLSFKDDKPAVVVTHGDLLSVPDRARVRVYLGELFGIPPAKQIFDIPDNSNLVTQNTIVDMLRYSLEHADRNLPRKTWVSKRVWRVQVSACVYLALIVGIAIIAACMKRTHRVPKSKIHIDWPKIRHMWLE